MESAESALANTTSCPAASHEREHYTQFLVELAGNANGLGRKVDTGDTRTESCP